MTYIHSTSDILLPRLHKAISEETKGPLIGSYVLLVISTLRLESQAYIIFV